ncbi:glycosyltransferase family 4 protein [Patescibacteria group bacterium]|nr:glycosyltransferase family 4 protein [Patescibacteria group bacterium]
MPRDNFVSRILLKRIKKIITISQGLKDFYVEKFNVIPDAILVAHDGVDLKDFLITIDKDKEIKRLNLPTKKPIVMYLGRLDPWKGVQTLLEASKILNDIQVVVVGEGSELEIFRKEYPNVIFKGLLPYRDLAYNQRVADILVIPNSGKSKVSSFYTSPLKVFAHMSSSVPVVVSDLPALREVLDENNSILVESDNPENLAEGIKKVLGDKNLAEKISQQALIDVKKYTWELRAKNILNFIWK